MEGAQRRLPPHKQLWRWYRSQVHYVQWGTPIILFLLLAAGLSTIRGGYLDERRNLERLLTKTRGDEAVETVRCSRSGSSYRCRVKCDSGRSFIVRVPVGGGKYARGASVERPQAPPSYRPDIHPPVTEEIIPPQEDLKRELRERAEEEEPSRCPRCGTARQRFLRRCPKCNRRYRSLGKDAIPPSTNIPGHWARDD
jgi:hypothetical protein